MELDLKRFRGRCHALEFRLTIALGLMTKLQRAQYNKAYYKFRAKGGYKKRRVVRRKFKGHVPGTEKPQSDRMDLGE